MIASPVLAASAPVPAGMSAKSSAVLNKARVGSKMKNESNAVGSVPIAILALIAAGLGVVAATSGGGNNNPTSP
jgi:urocanate hydratase